MPETFFFFTVSNPRPKNKTNPEETASICGRRAAFPLPVLGAAILDTFPLR
jgi:hypothetical protein